jgi:transcriptional regulator with XRE-family HTH domain
MLREILDSNNLDTKGITLNELAKISGISNTYFNYIKAGKIKNPGREKIIAIAIGLNYSLEEIDKLLRHNDYKEVSDKDFDIFIASAKNRDITGFQPLYENINYPIYLLALDNLAGNKYVVNKKPSSTLESTEYLMFRDNLRSRGNTNPIYVELKRAIHLERKRLLDKLLENNEVHYLVCDQCLNSYISRSKNSSREKKFIKEHFEELARYMDHSHYFFNIIMQCPRLRFIMKILPNSQNRKNKLIYTGYGEHRHTIDKKEEKNPRDRLFGMATDSSKFLEHFRIEYEELERNFIADEFSGKKKMQGYIKKIIDGLT